MKMQRVFYYEDKVPDECVYCNRITVNGDRMQLPNREFEKGKWHRGCVSRFITDGIMADNMEYKDEYVDYIFDNLPDSFVKLIEKANAREKELNYKKIILTV